ncbi:phosphoadenylyl-sulfate reductase [Candidatus Cyanaurora vandensis]|uniref:phosphoadenylyl-sulfate reductase n=1 Tax=Candidatus Cyanaurora vandensis TaxID=2714958 RepID=UPI00257B2782|nr:phosphoadenylyl-sulfate reductase [Candidatus Cyanaurora vandensis]
MIAISSAGTWVDQRAEEFAEAPTEDLLRWVIDQYGADFTVACAFGPESIILIDLLSQLQPVVQAFFLDTGFHFQATLDLQQKMTERYPNLALTVVRPRLNVSQQNAVYGADLPQQNPDQCCQLRKVEPLQRALQGYRCWLSGLRREHAPNRSQTPLLHWDSRQMLKVNPLADWSKGRMWQYILERGLPYNSLLDEGYTSIGCAPCTRRPLPDTDERSGRWQGTTKRECGIHL